MSAILEVKHLVTAFPGPQKNLPLRAVNDISFSLQQGRILGLVGESGSGKSVTGFSIMRQIDKPGYIESGEIIFAGQNLLTASAQEMQQIRGKRIAMVFQDPMMTLDPVLRIETQMIEAITAHEKISKAAARERCIEALGIVGIPSPEERLRAYPHEFSGGMRQRVAIAIALLHHPDVIIADEPTTALDVTIQAQILAEFQSLTEKFKMSVIWITHDLALISRLADDLLVMYAGRLVETGPTANVLSTPHHPYTEGLIASIPSQNHRGELLHQIPGMTPSLLNLPSGCAFRERCQYASSECQQLPATCHAINRTWSCFHPTNAHSPQG